MKSAAAGTNHRLDIKIPEEPRLSSSTRELTKKYANTVEMVQRY
jgi:hypothetical protein